MSEQGAITLVLERLRAGETDAEAELMRLVYGELRKIAMIIP
jgi:hypothetical protein